MSKKVPSLIERLENIAPSEDKLDELYSLFNSIKSKIPLVQINMEKDTFITRQRICDKGKLFNYTHELSYPPIEYTSYGRANIPGNPMFYGCVNGVDQTGIDSRIVTLKEISDFLVDTESLGIQRVQLSVWKVLNRLCLLSLPFSNNYENPMDIIKEIQNGWKSISKEENTSKDHLDFIMHMSDEIAKETTDYFFVSNFVYYLLYLNEDTKHLDGIIYPSVPAQGAGFNVAIKPESVDKKLKFYSASLYYLVKNKEKARYDEVKHSASVEQDGHIVFEQKTDFDEKKYEGLTFVN